MSTKWFYCDQDGFLVSTLYLSDAEYAARDDKDRLSRDEWPERPAGQVDQIALARAGAIQHIKNQCAAALAESIVVGGIALNPDVSSISAKLFELDTSPSADTSWRDAGNVTHQLAASELRALLSSAMAAISRRNTSLRQVMWAKREAIEGASTVEEIAAAVG